MIIRPAFLILLLFSLLPASAQRVVTARPVKSPINLPLEVAFKGQAQFDRIVTRAKREQWHRLPMGERVMRCGLALTGIPYKGFTLEIHDRIESPSVNMLGLDCWTFFETAMGMARMLSVPQERYHPIDLLREIETTRYRGGQCNGHYLERLHYLAEWYFDNDARGTIDDLTARLGGVRFKNRRLTEMTTLWKSYRYLRNNPSYRPLMRQHERRIERLPVRYIPRSKVKAIEPKLKNGDVIGIATKYQGGFCSHVGLAYKAKDGSTRFVHASSDPKKVIVDVPIHKYLYRYNKNMGILVGRPLEITQTVRDAGRYRSNLRKLADAR